MVDGPRYKTKCNIFDGCPLIFSHTKNLADGRLADEILEEDRTSVSCAVQTKGRIYPFLLFWPFLMEVMACACLHIKMRDSFCFCW